MCQVSAVAMGCALLAVEDAPWTYPMWWQSHTGRRVGHRDCERDGPPDEPHAGLARGPAERPPSVAAGETQVREPANMPTGRVPGSNAVLTPRRREGPPQRTPR